MKQTLGRIIILGMAAVTFTACSSTSAAPLLVSTANPSSSGAAAAEANAPDPQCTPLPDSSPSPVESAFTLSGACSFTDHTAAQCVVRPGDYYIYIHHDLPDDGQFVLTVNVESYSSPGSYKNGQVYLQITRHNLFYYWSTNTATVTILDGQAAAAVSKTTLAAQAGTPASGTIEASGRVACPAVS